MSGSQSKKAAYRQRVYQDADGTIELVFSDDPAPVGATLLADHDIVETVTVTDHVEPVTTAP